jgi:hypothetical protein
MNRNMPDRAIFNAFSNQPFKRKFAGVNFLDDLNIFLLIVLLLEVLLNKLGLVKVYENRV